MSDQRQTELSGRGSLEARRECSPSSPPLRQSVAKVRKHTARKSSSGSKKNEAGAVVRKSAINVPVVDSQHVPLMPCTPKRARKMIESGKATPFWSKGVFCIRLNVEPSARNMQNIAVGVDPGSKKEGFSVVSKKFTFLNVQTDARTGVKEKVENRRSLRRGRRNRNTPYRTCRPNRAANRKPGSPPSTKARWDWKLRILKWLSRLYPISAIVVEDIKAKTVKGKGRKWNLFFSPLEVGKHWFYGEVSKLTPVILKQGYETQALRDHFGLKKLSNKMSENFHAHCVDAWVLAADVVGAVAPTQKHVLCVVYLDYRRRSLHLQVPGKNGKRRGHGSTRTAGWRRGALVVAPKYGLVYLGGAREAKPGKVALHSLKTGERLDQYADFSKCSVIGYNSTRHYWAPASQSSNRVLLG